VDVLVLCAILIPTLACVLGCLRPMIYSFLDRDAAFVLRVRPARWEPAFFFLLGLAVATASKAAGALLVFCYLVVPASTALMLSRRLKTVLILAASFSAAATLIGFALSFTGDLPTNQTICAISCALLIGAFPLNSKGRRRAR